MRLNGAVAESVDSMYALFRTWIKYLQPKHKLTEAQSDILAWLIYWHHKLSISISDPEILNRELNGNYVRDQIIDSCGITKQNYQVIFGKLRKMGIITADGIEPKLLPKFLEEENPKSIKLLIIIQKE